MRLIRLEAGLYVDPRQVVALDAISVNFDKKGDPTTWAVRLHLANGQKLSTRFLCKDEPDDIIAQWADAISSASAVPERL